MEEALIRLESLSLDQLSVFKEVDQFGNSLIHDLLVQDDLTPLLRAFQMEGTQIEDFLWALILAMCRRRESNLSFVSDLVAVEVYSEVLFQLGVSLM